MRLLYLAEPKFGGWITYTTHLSRCLGAPVLGLSSRPTGKPSPFDGEVPILKHQILDLMIAARSSGLLITALDKHNLQSGILLLKAGARLVIHDPTELHEELVQALQSIGRPVLTIRKANQARLEAMGIPATFIRHPYIRRPEPPKVSDPARRGVVFSRIDWDKNTHVIAAANARLGGAQRIAIWGAMNRMYAHHKLDSAFPAWREEYQGPFAKTPWAGVGLAETARWVIDLSVIAGDGGGTQYTFLEAWDARRPLIVHGRWLRPQDDLVAGENCVAIGTPEELCERVLEEPSAALARAGEACLSRHGPEEIQPAVAAFMTA